MGAFKEGVIYHSEFLKTPALIEKVIYEDKSLRRHREEQDLLEDDFQLTLPFDWGIRFPFRDRDEPPEDLQRCS